MEGEAIEYDSYMIPTSDLDLGDLRLLEVDNRVVLPVNTHVRVVVSGADVIHSFCYTFIRRKGRCGSGKVESGPPID